MAKNIIFCADGTWNGPDERTGVSATDDSDTHGEVEGASVTNVVKLFANLAGQVTPETSMLKNEQEKLAPGAAGAPAQVSKYVHGVGDSANPVVKVLGGVFGLGIIARIVRGYTFISRHYAPGDAIVITGFSRGAYTARALGGMICKVGLLDPATYDPNDKEKAYRLGIAAWAKSKSLQLQGAGKATAAANALLGFVEHFIAEQLPANGLIADVPIKAVAVWDTVGSLGIPVYAGSTRLDLFRFIDTGLGAKVERGFHAMAIDEMRADFPVTRWDDRNGIEQVWFVGAHADVGGGYPAAESRLSDTALGWLSARLASVGVALTVPPAYVANPQVIGQPVHTPWTQPPFDLLGKAARNVKAADKVHASVAQRWNADAAYRPAALNAFAPNGPGPGQTVQ